MSETVYVGNAELDLSKVEVQGSLVSIENKNYYKIGDLIGVPWVKEQELAYKLGKEEFIRVGRAIYNAGINSKLNVYPHTEFNKIFL